MGNEDAQNRRSTTGGRPATRRASSSAKQQLRQPSSSATTVPASAPLPTEPRSAAFSSVSTSSPTRLAHELLASVIHTRAFARASACGIPLSIDAPLPASPLCAAPPLAAMPSAASYVYMAGAAAGRHTGNWHPAFSFVSTSVPTSVKTSVPTSVTSSVTTSVPTSIPSSVPTSVPTGYPREPSLAPSTSQLPFSANLTSEAAVELRSNHVESFAELQGGHRRLLDADLGVDAAHRLESTGQHAKKSNALTQMKKRRCVLQENLITSRDDVNVPMLDADARGILESVGAVEEPIMELDRCQKQDFIDWLDQNADFFRCTSLRRLFFDLFGQSVGEGDCCVKEKEKKQEGRSIDDVIFRDFFFELSALEAELSPDVVSTQEAVRVLRRVAASDAVAEAAREFIRVHRMTADVPPPRCAMPSDARHYLKGSIRYGFREKKSSKRSYADLGNGQRRAHFIDDLPNPFKKLREGASQRSTAAERYPPSVRYAASLLHWSPLYHYPDDMRQEEQIAKIWLTLLQLRGRLEPLLLPVLSRRQLFVLWHLLKDSDTLSNDAYDDLSRPPVSLVVRVASLHASARLKGIPRNALPTRVAALGALARVATVRSVARLFPRATRHSFAEVIEEWLGEFADDYGDGDLADDDAQLSQLPSDTIYEGPKCPKCTSASPPPPPWRLLRQLSLPADLRNALCKEERNGAYTVGTLKRLIERTEFDAVSGNIDDSNGRSVVFAWIRDCILTLLNSRLPLIDKFYLPAMQPILLMPDALDRARGNPSGAGPSGAAGPSFVFAALLFAQGAFLRDFYFAEEQRARSNDDGLLRRRRRARSLEVSSKRATAFGVPSSCCWPLTRRDLHAIWLRAADKEYYMNGRMHVVDVYDTLAEAPAATRRDAGCGAWLVFDASSTSAFRPSARVARDVKHERRRHLDQQARVFLDRLMQWMPVAP